MNDSEAFETFVRDRYGPLVRLAFLLTGDRGRAEDLTQEALVRTCSAWGRLERVDNAEAFTRRVMIRLSWRWAARRSSGERPSEAALLDQPAAQDDVTAFDTTDSVLRALADLPTMQRAVLVLRFYEGRSEAEIAALLRCRPGTVKSRTARALAALRASGLLDEPNSIERPGGPHVRR